MLAQLNWLLGGEGGGEGGGGEGGGEGGVAQIVGNRVLQAH